MSRLLVASLSLLLSLASVAHAEEAVVCSQVVKYTRNPFPQPPLSSQPPKLQRPPVRRPFGEWREVPLGTWEGEVQLARSRLCIGFVIEPIDYKDELDVTYAYNSETFAPMEIAGISRFGVRTSQSGRYYKGILTVNGSEPVSFDFHSVNDDTLKGFLIHGSAKYDARIKRPRVTKLLAD